MTQGDLCPTCGCSLVRLGIPRADAAREIHDGQEFLFCCEGCLELFREDPRRYVSEVSDWVVCPACLAEKPKALTVTVAHNGETIHFCRCPCCIDAFQKDPEKLLRRLSA